MGQIINFYPKKANPQLQNISNPLTPKQNRRSNLTKE